jgi:hypothetical protein
MVAAEQRWRGLEERSAVARGLGGWRLGFLPWGLVFIPPR